MESFSARRPSQRRAPAEQSQSAPQPHTATSHDRSRSEDSQTIFVNNVDEEQSEQAEQEQQQSQHPLPPPLVDDDIQKCWICFSDSTEDTPESSPWRDPCPCALVAHEDCLLDWIADAEDPANPRNAGVRAPKIECPQCKAEIKLARPRDYLVDVVRGVERASSKVVTPAALTVLSGAIYNISMYWGEHSIYAIFGDEDGFRILRPLIYNATRPPIEVHVGSPRELLKVVLNHLVHWRLYFGLPLVGPILILSRTSILDGVLPVLPILFFTSQAHSPNDALDFALWPPSASFAFAVLPYVRGLYNLYYNKVWAEKEKQWLKDIQPRTTQDQTDADMNAINGRQDDDNVFEVRIDGGVIDDWEDDDPVLEELAVNQPQQMQQQEDEGAPAPVVQDNRPLPQGGGNEHAPQVAQQPQPQPQPANQQENGERRLVFSPRSVAEKALGAILFPTIAGLSGELLKIVLPNSWTTPPRNPRLFARIGVKGFWQHKWARSIVGGCLFVVCKDALMLYVRWKMAQMHRSRRVVDFDRRKGNGKKAAAS